MALGNQQRGLRLVLPNQRTTKKAMKMVLPSKLKVVLNSLTMVKSREKSRTSKYKIMVLIFLQMKQEE